VPATIQIPGDGGSLGIARTVTEGVHSLAEDPLGHGKERQTRYPLDPNAVIAAAFKAACLPVPEMTTARGTSPQVEPGPIIAAALKAAGLVQT
jgi:hypothetical protein